MTQNLMLKNGKWINAIEEPYYPNIFEKIKHFFGIHIYPDFYRGQSKCLICGNIKLILGNSYYYSKDKNKWECIEIGKVVSKFKNNKGIIGQFYNEDMYETKFKSTTSPINNLEKK